MHSFWLYISRARIAPRCGDEALIYLQARSRNARDQITGYLHREDGHYIQYVEGPAAMLLALRRDIRNDWRHRQIRTLAEGRVESRRFEGWDMAVSDEEMVSFSRFQRENRATGPIAGASADLILAFMGTATREGVANSVAHTELKVLGEAVRH